MSDSQRFSNLFGQISGRSAASSLEDKLKRWAQKPSDTETEKCERTVRMIKDARSKDAKLSNVSIDVYAKGSYANRTNIPSDSDVDVAFVYTGKFYNTYPEGLTAADFGYPAGDQTFESMKSDVAYAIKTYFGSENVTVGNKAIEVHASSARVDADVVTHCIHRRYVSRDKYYEGVALKTSDGKLIYNWPKQDYDNGVAKNEATGKRYKALTRILKNLRCEMKDEGIKSAEAGVSYLIACLAYNLPNYIFDEATYSKMTEDALEMLVDQTSDLNNVSKWTEVNEMKWLFSTGQSWKIDDVHTFLVDALKYFRGLK